LRHVVVPAVFVLRARGSRPCPTLSIVIGLALVLGGLGSRAWSVVVGATGIFYGIFGAAHLGVRLDWVLLLGALMSVLAVPRGFIDGTNLQ